MKTLGKKISEVRKLHGMTQEELAVKLNVSSAFEAALPGV